MNKSYFPSLSQGPDSLPTVEISISTDYLKDVLSFLLTGNISFGMSYESKNLSENPLEEPIDLPNALPESRNVSGLDSLRLSRQSVMEAIYQKYIHDSIEKTPPAESVIAKEYNLPLSVFKRNFKSCYGKSFYQLNMEKKMKYAKKLLLDGINATGVSKRLGYTQSIKFNNIFRKYCGMTPKQYQMKHRMK